MALSQEHSDQVIDFVEQMAELLDLVKRMENGSGFTSNFKKALAIAENAKPNSIRALLLQAQQK